MFALKRIPSYAAVLLLFCSSLLFTNQLRAQAPEGINYQAVARNNTGDPLANQIISVRFSVVANSTSGTVLYQEDHSAISTNSFGLFNLVIGVGSSTGGSLPNFASIDWSTGSKFLRVQVDAGSGFENLGTTQLLSVPYALYAKTSGNASSTLSGGNGITIRNDSIINDGDLSETNELITSFSIEAGNILRISEATTNFDVDLTPLLPTTADDQNLSFSSNGDSILIDNGDGIEIQFILDDIANNTTDILANQSGISDNAQGIIDSTLDIRAALADSAADLRSLFGTTSDNQNLRISNDSIIIDRGTGVDIEFLATDAKLSADSATLGGRISTNETAVTNLDADLTTLGANFSDDSTLTIQNRDSIDVLAGLITTDNDADSTNELISNITLVDDTLKIFENGILSSELSLDTLFNFRRLNLFNRTIANRDSIRILDSLIGIDNDPSASNEIQQLSLVANQLSIDDPSGTVTQTPIDLSIYDNPEDSTRIANGSTSVFIPTANDSISFVAGGTEALRIDNAGRSYFKQAVGIGTSNPDSLFEVNGGVKVGSLNVNGAYTLPVTDGIGQQILQTDGSGSVSWSSVLPTPNCPTGMTNVQGNICIETNERAASDWYDAANTCASLGYKLPTWAEWYGAATNAVLTNEINNWEWVSDGTSNTARKVGNTNLKNTANDDPETGSANFRCIFYK